MNAEIIAVGSEMLTPDRVDTNSLWLTARLNELGVEVTRKSIVGDNRDRLAEEIAGSLQRVPMLILSGGLGPTEDDVTREAVAQALHRRLLFNEEACSTIEAFFSARGRKMTDNNRRQAFSIEGAELLPNHNGTAPGQWLDLPGGMCFLLPGPPRELKPLFTEACLPRLRERLPRLHIATRFYRVAGIGESDLDSRIAPLYKPYENPVTTLLAAEGDVQIHLRARADSDAAAEALAEELGQKILAEVGDACYSTNGQPLEAVLGEMLVARNATLAVAESCTAGLLGARLTESPGASRWFLGGLQVYTDAMKTALAGVPAELIEKHTAVSPEVAEALALGVRARTGATYALSITGEAGPGSATGAPEGTVYLGLATPSGVSHHLARFPTGRPKVRNFAVQNALNLLRKHLLQE